MSHGHSLQLDFQMRASSADSIRASRFFGLHNRPDIRLLLPTRQHGYLLSSGRRPYKDFPKLRKRFGDELFLGKRAWTPTERADQLATALGPALSTLQEALASVDKESVLPLTEN